MQRLGLGASGLEASRVALGAWAIGGWMWGGQEESDSIRTIHAALDAGINFIDTAPMYGMGRSEEVVGKAIRGRRDRVVVATKCGMRWDLKKGKLFFRTNEEAIDNASGEHEVYIYNGPESVREEVERSLQRLGTDYIDLLQTHWQDETTPIQETAGELSRLQAEGKIRAFGLCNATVAHMEAYRSMLPLASDQEKYSLLDREKEAEQLPYCVQHSIAFLAYAPLSNGLLTGKVTPGRTFPATDLRAQRPRFSQASRAVVSRLMEELQPIAHAHGATLAQLAIAWTLHQPGVTHALVGARRPEQAQENAQAAQLRLTPQELEQIAAASQGVAEQVGSSAAPRAE